MRHVVAMLAGSAMAGCSLIVSLDDLTGSGSDASTDVFVGVDAADAQNAADISSKDVVAEVGDDQDSEASTVDYSATILADGPLAYFHLDELTGTALKDSSGNHHDATLVSGVALGGAGAFAGSGTSVHLNGSGYISIDNSVNTNGTPFDFVAEAPFTLEMWASIDAPAPNAGYTFFSKEQSIGNSQFLGLDFFLQPNVILQRENGSNGVTEADAQSGFATINTWYYLVGTYDGNAITIYVDNVVVGSFLGSQTSIPITNVPFLFGSEDTGLDSALVGKMDEVAIYAKALTSTQVAAHFHAAGK